VTGNEATTANVNAITIVAAKSVPIFLMLSDILPRGYNCRHN
jgi:hypothetical protein